MNIPDSELINILDGSAESPEGSAARPSAIPEDLPILGLADIVIFPGMPPVPLLVESAQSIRLIDDVVAGDRFLGLVLQHRPEIENPHALGSLPVRLRRAGAQDAQIPRQHRAGAGGGPAPDSHPRLYGGHALFAGASRGGLGFGGRFHRVYRPVAERPPAVRGDHQPLSDALGADQDRGDQHRGPGPVVGSSGGESESQSRGAAAVTGDRRRQGAAHQAAAPDAAGGGGPQSGFKDPAGGRQLHVEEPARLLPARATARDSARTGGKRTRTRPKSARCGNKSRPMDCPRRRARRR